MGNETWKPSDFALENDFQFTIDTFLVLPCITLKTYKYAHIHTEKQKNLKLLENITSGCACVGGMAINFIYFCLFGSFLFCSTQCFKISKG